MNTINENKALEPDSKEIVELEWYKLSNNKICKDFKVNPNTGLTSQQVVEQQEIYGKNVLPRAKKPNVYMIFLKSFLDPLSVIMMIAGILSLVVSLIAGEITPPDIVGLVIIAVIVLTNSVIGTIQEIKSEDYLLSLADDKKITTIVLRDDEKQEIDIEDLVPGDIVFVNAGGFIPADIRIIDNQLLRIDESVLTGENEAVSKITQSIKEDNLVLGDQKNIAFMSTLILEGKMKGIVFGTGANSEIGKIASKITSHKKEKTPLEKKVTVLTTKIGIASIVLGLILFMIAWFMREQLDDNMKEWNKILLVAVSAAISLIPESLTIIVKICLTVAAKKMARKNVIVKNPKSIETLGAVNIICSDKTGTLTQNKMSIDKLFLDFKIQNLKTLPYKNNEEFFNCISLCSDAIISEERIGSATELATIQFAMNSKIDYLDLRSKYARVDEIPFDSKRKMMITVNNVNDKKMVYCKGACDFLVKECAFKKIGDEITPLTSDDVKTIEDSIVQFAKKGMRVLGFASKEINDNDKKYEGNLVFLGAVAIIDPPRTEVKEAIQTAKDGGIRVIMITGDHKITAQEIATRLGIYDSEVYNQVITGYDIDTLPREEFEEKIKHTNVFARVNPEHKAIIVELLQKQNNVVAMTGDGVNDSPSLVKADVGIAMGINGTQVTKEVSDVILADDNFRSIISGVNSGRNVYEKIKYSISFLLAANIAQVLTLIFILLINKDLALNSVNILFHIFIVETIVAIPIGMGKERKGVMKNLPPKHKKESLLNGIIVQIILTTLFNTLFACLSYQSAIWYFDDNVQLAQGYGSAGAYIAIIFSPIFYAILYNHSFMPMNYVAKEDRIDKYRPNKFLFIFMGLAFLLTAITLLPFASMNSFFDFKTVGLPIGLLAIFVALSIMPALFIWSSYQLILLIDHKIRLKRQANIQTIQITE